MAIIGSLVSNVVLLCILAVPWVVLFYIPTQKAFFRYLSVNLISLPIIFALVALLAWWPEFVRDFRLAQMGFDAYGMSEAERLQQVHPALIETAKQLYKTNMGIGWTLKALIGMVIFAPYPTVTITFWSLLKFLLSSLKNRLV